MGRLKECHCPPDGAWYCERCTGYAARAGVVLTSVGTSFPLGPAPLPTDAPEGALENKLRLHVMRDRKLLYYHTYNSKRSDPGWPDCAIIHPEGGTLFLWELKQQGKHPSPAQQRWLNALQHVTAVDARVVYPTDWERMRTWLTRNT